MSFSHNVYPHLRTQNANNGMSRTTSMSSGLSLPFDHASETPSAKLELSIAARNLVDADIITVSDPMCVVYTRSPVGQKWVELGRTEIIWNNLNPQWVKKFKIDYYFEEVQPIKFVVYDADTRNASNLSKQDFLGQTESTIAEIVSAGSVFHKKLEKIERGDIEVRAEELIENHDLLSLQFRGIKLDRKDFFGKSDPFFTISKANEAGGYTIVHKSEFIKITLNPNWAKFKVKVQALCNGDIDRELRIEVFDWNANGEHKLIGMCNTTVRELEDNPNNQWVLNNPKKRLKKGPKYKGSGILELQYSYKERIYTFFEYLQGGMEMNFEIGIDFTQSNGEPRDTESLHYINQNIPGHLNEYALAIRAVGDIVQEYDTDKLFPVYGFGARLPPNGQISHRFAVNFNPADPNCHRVEGCLEAYQRCVRSVRLWGPTNFSPIIRGFVDSAREDLTGRQYWVLLIITDGIISDMEPTKKAIVEAAKFPISIIIVGVGPADFDNMDVLDGDEVRVSYNGEYAVRDIVQFVPLRDFMKKGTGQVMSQARLAQEVLQEIPDQVTEYMSQHAITPMQPVMDYQRSVMNEVSNDVSQMSMVHQNSMAQQNSTKPPPNYY